MIQSTPYLIEFPRDVKHWMGEGHPPVDAARPSRCPICLSASRDARRGLTLYGHGLRERVQWGPPFSAQGPGRLRVETRRYQCQLCDAVVVVVPRGMLPRKRYSGSAIAFALALWSLGRRTEPEVFDRVSIFEICRLCIWGCEMPVEMIIDHWNPGPRQYWTETFCYGPKSCKIYRAGPIRKVPGRKGMSYTEEHWVDQDATSHREEDE